MAQVQPSGDEEQEEDTVAWVNAAVGRIFWDFLSEPHWAELVSKKIQMKLSKIRVSERDLPSPSHPLTLRVVGVKTGRQEKRRGRTHDDDGSGEHSRARLGLG